MDAIRAFQGSKYYAKFLDSFAPDDQIKIGIIKNRDITKAIYYHLSKIRYSEWKMRINCNRKVKHTSSGIFQDIIAYYLKLTLGSRFNISIEEKIGDIRPDIIIKFNNKYFYSIEIKTSIGWGRNSIEEKVYENRIDKIVKAFNGEILSNNIIFIFESVRFGNSDFEKQYWDHEKKCPKPRPKEPQYCDIYPLFFIGPDPYYWKYEKEINRNEEIIEEIELNKSKIIKRANENIICPFEEIIEKIKAASAKE